MTKTQAFGTVNSIIEIIQISKADQAKDIAFQLRNEVENLFCVLLADLGGRPSLTIMISEELIKKHDLNASSLVRDWAKEIKGGGGGQPFFAQAGGTDPNGLTKIKTLANNFVKDLG